MVAGEIRVTGNAGKLKGDGFWRKNVVNAAGSHGACGHIGIFSGSLVLGEGNAAVALDFRETGGSVGARAGEEDANGAIALRFSKRAHEVVNGHMKGAGLTAGCDL